MDHQSLRTRNTIDDSKSFKKLRDKARKVFLMQRFLSYTRKKVINNKINQEVVATSESKLDAIKKNIVENTFLVSTFGLIVSLINLYLAYQIPFRLAFYHDHRVPELYVHDLILDGILFVSLLIRMYVLKTKFSDVNTVKRPLLIFMFVFHIRFYTDFISLIPLYMIDNRWYWFKIARILRVNSIVTWIKYTRPPSSKLKNLIMNHYSSFNTVLTVLWFANMIMITCHCIACLWFYIPNELSTPNSLTWLGPSWATYSLSDNYMRSLYWTAVTFSSVGYGDITGKTTEEYIFSMFVEFLGIMCFGYLMGSLTSLVSSYQTKQEKIRYRENELTQWLIFVEDQIEDKKTQKEINESITNYFNHKWVCDPSSLSGFDDYFRTLPPDLALELSSHLFGPRLNIFRLFFNSFTKIQVEIASKLNTEKYICSGEIIRSGDKNQNIYLITFGNVLVGLTNMGYCITLADGAYFGEDSAIFDDESVMSFYNNSEVLLYYFKFKELKSIFKRSKPELWEFARLSFKRSKYFEAVTEYKFSGEAYISESELETYCSQFNISDPSMNSDEEAEFKERSQNLYEMFNKTEKEVLNPEAKKMIEDLKKESDDFGKELQSVKEKYEKELNRVILRMDQAIDAKKEIS